MSVFKPDDIVYRLDWRARSVQPGSHATRTPGGHADFRGFARFMDQPDPRRIDMRASLRQNPRQWMVRQYHERGAIVVYLIVDLSASMRFQGVTDKAALLRHIASSIAWSASRSGDAVAMFACDQKLREDCRVLPSARPGVAQQVWQQLLAVDTAQSVSADSLPLAVGQLRRKRSLVFLLSDFHVESALLARTLNAYASHDLVPVVLWDSAEYRQLPQWGWGRVRDMETGREHTLLFRPGLHRKISEHYEQRRAELRARCRAAGARAPFFVEDQFDAQRLTRHLLEGS
ncbi:DUF58 domain-containing protein [Methylobacillus flagellatus]|uniref:DUF58 domain-containing protein n=1 Tax=Methylobacillus flagellatus TaxID=405 RepID=UPI0010F8A506|nr:DUF58 domain-containing protein [Methylobacillus flagellatus]